MRRTITILGGVCTAALLLSACATGQGSYIAGAGGGGGDETFLTQDAGGENADYGVLAVSGSALLPGTYTIAALSAPGASGAPGVIGGLLGQPLVGLGLDGGAGALQGGSSVVTASLLPGGLTGQGPGLAGAAAGVANGAPVTSVEVAGASLAALDGRTLSLLGGPQGGALLGTSITPTLPGQGADLLSASVALTTNATSALDNPVTGPVTAPVIGLGQRIPVANVVFGGL